MTATSARTSPTRTPPAPPTAAGPPVITPVRTVELGSRVGYTMSVSVAVDAEHVLATHSFTPLADPKKPEGTGELVVLDRETLAPRHHVDVGVVPNRVEPAGGGRVVVVSSTAGLARRVVTLVDAVTGDPGWSVEKGFGISDVAVAPAGRRVLLADHAGGSVHVLDLDTGLTLATVPVGEHPIALAADDTRSRAYVAVNEVHGSAFVCALVVVDTAAAAVVQRLTLDTTNCALQDVAVDPVRDRVLVAAQGNVGATGPSLFVVAAATGSVSRIALLAPGRSVAVDPVSGRAVVASENRVWIVDPDAETVVEQGTFTGMPGRAAVDPASGLAWVGESATGRAVAYHLADPVPSGVADLTLTSSGRQMNLFRLAPDGTMETAAWTDGSDWSRFLPLGRAFSPGAVLTGLAPTPTGWWVFAVDAGGVLWGAAGDGTNLVAWHEIATGFAPGGSVAWAAPASGGVVVFAADATGTVRSFGWNGDGPSSPGTHGGVTVAPGAPIAAVSRKAGHWDLFVLHPDGRVYTQWWSTDEDAVSPWSALDGPPLAPGTRISCAGRKIDQLDLFAVDADGHVITNFWNDEQGWHAWGHVADDATFPPGSPVAVASHDPDNLTLFVVADDARLVTTFWDHDDGWSAWETIADSGRTPGAAVAAGRRGPGTLDACWLAPGGAVGHAWWSLLQAEWSSELGVTRTVGQLSTHHFAEIHTEFPVEGHVAITMWEDTGSHYVRGHMHGSGFDPYDFIVQASVIASIDADGIAALDTYRAGEVDGWQPFGDEDRSYDWVDLGSDPDNVFLYRQVRRSAPRPLVVSHAVKNDGIGGALQSLVDDVVGGHLGTDVLHAVAGTLVLGLGMGRAMENLVSTDLGTNGWLGFSILTVGTAGMWLVIPAGAVVVPMHVPFLDVPAFGAKARSMHDDEWAWASKVFGSELPHPDLIWITNLRSPKDSAFTSKDGDRYLVHLGAEAFEDPTNDVDEESHPAPGKGFIHELTHVWDAAHSDSTWEYPAVIAQLHLPDSVPDGTEDWGDLNTEEKAYAIADWYARYHGNLDSADATSDPLFHYVSENLRTGNN